MILGFLFFIYVRLNSWEGNNQREVMQNNGFITTQPMHLPVNNGIMPVAPGVTLYTTGANPQMMSAPQAQYQYIPTSYFIRYYVPVGPAGYPIPNLPKVINLPQGTTSYMPISAYNLNINSINTNSVPRQTRVETKPASITVQNQLPPQPQPQPLPALPPAPPAEPETAPVTPDKSLTPLTPELINHLNNSLTKGNKDERFSAIGKTLKLLREDPENRKNNLALVGLINKALNPVQPSEVKTAALIACENGLVANTPQTQQLVQALTLSNDKLENNSLASSALNRLQTGA